MKKRRLFPSSAFKNAKQKQCFRAYFAFLPAGFALAFAAGFADAFEALAFAAAGLLADLAAALADGLAAVATDEAFFFDLPFPNARSQPLAYLLFVPTRVMVTVILRHKGMFRHRLV